MEYAFYWNLPFSPLLLSERGSSSPSSNGSIARLSLTWPLFSALHPILTPFLFNYTEPGAHVEFYIALHVPHLVYKQCYLPTNTIMKPMVALLQKPHVVVCTLTCPVILLLMCAVTIQCMKKWSISSAVVPAIFLIPHSSHPTSTSSPTSMATGRP